MSDAKIFPVLLSGGSGSRLWPLSRESTPKQLLPLIGEGTLLQQAARRVCEAGLFEPLTIIGSDRHGASIAEQMAAIAADATIVLEPAPRNTAPAAAIAALLISRERPDALMLLMPADHVISDTNAFQATVRRAEATACNGCLTLFGILPDSPATGYGYIKAGEPIGNGQARHVAAFVEKPDQAKAEQYLASGDYLWNSGIFLLRVDALLAELAAFEPDMLAAATQAVEHAERDAGSLHIERSSFAQCRAISIDHAVIERTDKAAVVSADFGWADVGSWSALWSMAKRDETETTTIGDVLTLATRQSYIRSEGPLVATIGIEDLIVIATPEAVLVAHKDHDQDIREIVDRLKREKPGLF